MQKKSSNFKIKWGGTDLNPGFTVLVSLISSDHVGSFLILNKEKRNVEWMRKIPWEMWHYIAFDPTCSTYNYGQLILRHAVLGFNHALGS